MSRQIAEFAFDLHSGLAAHRVSEFDDLHTIGMAATLAIHIKGLGEIDYQVLRKVSDHLMSIPSVALEKVLHVLADIGFVKLVEKGRKIEKVLPNIPIFDDIYAGVGEYAASECKLNSTNRRLFRFWAHYKMLQRTRIACKISLESRSHYLRDASLLAGQVAYCLNIKLEESLF